MKSYDWLMLEMKINYLIIINNAEVDLVSLLLCSVERNIIHIIKKFVDPGPLWTHALKLNQTQ
jgi:hypothetical protein